MTPIASGLWVVAEHAFPLCKLSLMDGLHVKGSPALNRSMIFGSCRTPGDDNGKRPLAFQLRLLHLLTRDKAAEEKETDT
jgi:hypothetical protein